VNELMYVHSEVMESWNRRCAPPFEFFFREIENLWWINNSFE